MSALANISQLYNDACSAADLMPSVQLQRVFSGLTFAKVDNGDHQILKLDASQCLFTRSHFELFLEVLQKIVQQIVESVAQGSITGALPIQLHLSLRNTGLDNGTVLTLANAVAQLDGLDHIIVAEGLDISDNVNVSTVGGKRLKRLCKEYQQLKFLNLNGCSLNAALQRQIEESTAENSSIAHEEAEMDAAPVEDGVAAVVTVDAAAEDAAELQTRAESPDHQRITEVESASPTAVVEQKTPQTEPRNTQHTSLTPSPPRQLRADTSGRSEAGTSRLRADRLEQSDNLSCATENDPEMALAHKSDGTSQNNSMGEAPDFTSYTMPPDLTVAQQAPLSLLKKIQGNTTIGATVVAPAISPRTPASCSRGFLGHHSQPVAAAMQFPLMSRLSIAVNKSARVENDLSFIRPLVAFGGVKSIRTSATPRLDSLLDRLQAR